MRTYTDDRDRLFPNSLEWEVYSTTGTVQLSSLMSVNRATTLDTCLWREIRYFSHTYQYRFWMLLECNAALNRRISLGKKKDLTNPDQNDILKGCNPMGVKSLSL